jgi:hypothetical protein
MNGAAEAILEDLLRSSLAQQAILQRLAGSFSPTNSSSATAGLTAVGRAATTASVALTNITSGAFNILSNMMSGLGSIIGQTIGHFVTLGSNLFDFAKKAAYGTAQLSDFINVFKDLPLVGRAFELFAGVIKYQEELLGVYRNLSNSGATFGGSLQAMNHAANSAYLSLNEFQSVVQKNSDLFAGLGGANVDRGIVAFVDANKKLMGPDSEYAQGILGLGVTAEQASGFLATTMRSQGFKDKQSTATADQLAKYTNEYVKTLDDMSRLTGMRRDQLDEEVKKAEQDSLFETFKDGLSSAQSAAVTNMLAMAAPYGKAAVDEVKARLRGLDAPVSDAGAQLAVVTNGMSLAGEGVRKGLNGTVEEQRKAMGEYLGGMARAQNQTVKQVGTLGQAAGVLGDMVNGPLQRIGRLMEKGMTFEQALQQATLDQAKAAVGSAARLAKAEQDIKIFGKNMNDIFMNLISPIAGPLTTFSGSILKAIDAFVSSDGFQKTLEGVTKWMSTTFKDMEKSFNQGGWKSLLKTTFDKLVEGFSSVKDFLTPIWEQTIKPGLKSMWETISDTMTPYMLKAFDLIMDSIDGYLYKKSFGVLGKDPEELKLKRYSQEKSDESRALLESYTKLKSLTGDAAANIDPAKLTETRSKLDQAMKDTQQAAVLYGKYIGGDKTVRAPETRHSGTIGMTGNWWEKEDTTANIQQGESVVTQSQMEQIVGSASQTGLAQSIQQLNSLTTQMLTQMKQTAEYTRRNYDATRALGGNLFEAV